MLLRLSTFFVVMVAFLVACAPEEKEPTIDEDGNVFTASSELYPAQNLTALEANVRPMFLSSYADW